YAAPVQVQPVRLYPRWPHYHSESLQREEPHIFLLQLRRLPAAPRGNPGRDDPERGVEGGQSCNGPRRSNAAAPDFRSLYGASDWRGCSRATGIQPDAVPEQSDSHIPLPGLCEHLPGPVVSQFVDAAESEQNWELH